MSLIDEVARLKDLGAKATPGECIAIEDDDRSGDFLLIQNKEHWAWKDGSNSPDAKYIAALRNAAPKLLDVLGDFRAGDAAEIDWIIKNYGCTLRDHIDVLHRYRDIARKMEATK
jgi:hypothetical protein